VEGDIALPVQAWKWQNYRVMPEQPTNAGHPLKQDEVPAPAGDKDAVSRKLTPEEQMALFEKELKEDDWGHQPC